MTNEKILSCPFCGNESPEVATVSSDMGDGRLYEGEYVDCAKCGYCQVALAAWQRRVVTNSNHVSVPIEALNMLISGYGKIVEIDERTEQWFNEAIAKLSTPSQPSQPASDTKLDELLSALCKSVWQDAESGSLIESNASLDLLYKIRQHVRRVQEPASVQTMGEPAYPSQESIETLWIKHYTDPRCILAAVRSTVHDAIDEMRKPPAPTLAEGMDSPKSACLWWADGGHGLWESSCGVAFEINEEETPKSCGMKFCHKCGGELIVVEDEEDSPGVTDEENAAYSEKTKAALSAPGGKV